MPQYVKRSQMPVEADELFAWHLRPGALQRLLPPWETVCVLERRGGLHDGGTVVLALRKGPLALRWEARHRDFIPGRQFAEDQVRGPFARWAHLHRIEQTGIEESLLTDAVTYVLPGGRLGQVFGGAFVRRELQRMFAFRHEQTRHDLLRHRQFKHRPRLAVAVSGASGLIGGQLCPFLTTGGHTVHALVRRRPNPALGEIHWDPAAGEIDTASLEGLDAVVHLAGENVGAGRWTAHRKRRILSSRVEGTALLAAALAKLAKPPRVLVCASASGYYGDRDFAEDVTEESGPGRGFLADVTRKWEAAAEPAGAAGIRVVHARFGMVLSGRGGALPRMLPAFRLGLGGRLGDGRQPLSWIALDDAVGLLHWLLWQDGLSGPVNAAAPQAVNNSQFTRALARLLRRPAGPPLPSTALRLLFGEMGQELLLQGARIVPQRALAAGFQFRHGELESALRAELGLAAVEQ